MRNASIWARSVSPRSDNTFAVLTVEHEASNNLGSEAARLLGRGTIERGTYKNRFECVLAAVPMVPRRIGPRPRRMDVTQPGSYFLSFVFQTEVEHFRVYAGPDHRQTWRNELPGALAVARKNRSKVESE